MGSYLNKQKLIISSNHKELTNEKIQILTAKTILNRYQIINLHSIIKSNRKYHYTSFRAKYDGIIKLNI